MCGNTSLSSSAAGGSGGGGGSGGDHHHNGGCGGDNTHSKKIKKQKVPKRGPGVAELEKILREQEMKNETSDNKTENDEGLTSFLPPLPNGPNPYQPAARSPVVVPTPNSLPKNFPFPRDHHHPDHLTPSKTSLYPSPGSSDHVGKSGTSDGVHIGRSSSSAAAAELVLPEHVLLPTVWSNPSDQSTRVDAEGPRSASRLISLPTYLTNGSNHQHFPPPPPPHSPTPPPPPPPPSPSPHAMLPKSQCSPPPMVRNLQINLFPQSSMPTPTIPSSGLCHGLEPPSSQTSYHRYTPVRAEEDKMVGAKRARPLPMEIPPIPHLCYPVPVIAPQMSRLDSPSPFPCSGIYSRNTPEPREPVSRETKPVSSLEQSSKKSTGNFGGTKGKFMLFGRPTTPPRSTTTSDQPVQHKPNPFSLQKESKGEVKDVQQHRAERSGTTAVSLSSSSASNKSLYSFLIPRERMGLVEGPGGVLDLDINEKPETKRRGGDALDLNLRL